MNAQLQQRGTSKKNRLQQHVGALLHQQNQANHPEQQHPLQQVGAVLQHQFRVFRKRHHSSHQLHQLPVQAIVNAEEEEEEVDNDYDDDCNSERRNLQADQWSCASDTVASTTSSVTSSLFAVEPYQSFFDGDERAITKLTPKKKCDQSPLPKSTTKIALYRSDSNSADSLLEALYLWMEAANQLFRSREMNDVVTRSWTVCYHAGAVVVRTVALPITVPVHLCNATAQLILSISTSIVYRAASVLVEDKSAQQQQSSGEGSEEKNNNGNGGIIRGVLSIPGTIFSVTGQIVLAVVAPVLGHEQQQQQKGVSSPERKEKSCPTSSSLHQQALQSCPDYLDRLRLDYVPKEGVLLHAGDKFFSSRKKVIPLVEQSDYLLRVNDLCIRRPEDDAEIYYVDLSPVHAAVDQQQIVSQAQDQLVEGALRMLANHPVCSIDTAAYPTTPQSAIHWHPEGSTKRILRSMDQLSDSERLQMQQQEILIWSGRFQNNLDGYGRKHGFFLARGCIDMAPELFVKLLWDNSRTSEYNNFCLGRSTLHCVGDDADDRSFLDGTATTASKVIRSEMRVPFAGITVRTVCLMHVRPLKTITASAPSADYGFVIVSRTLDSGPAGTRTSSPLAAAGASNNNKPAAKNEILWGCNVIRSVPGCAGVTELTSLSQVGSSVPWFLAQKIGLMGITDFFKNVRAVAAAASAADADAAAAAL